MRLRSWIGLFVLTAVLLTFFYVWPGVWRYRYYEAHESWGRPPLGLGSSGSATHSMRTDRLAGEVQVWDEERGGWKRCAKKARGTWADRLISEH